MKLCDTQGRHPPEPGSLSLWHAIEGVYTVSPLPTRSRRSWCHRRNIARFANGCGEVRRAFYEEDGWMFGVAAHRRRLCSPQRCSMVCVVRKWYSLLTRNLSIVTVGSVLVGKVVEQWKSVPLPCWCLLGWAPSDTTWSLSCHLDDVTCACIIMYMDGMYVHTPAMLFLTL